MKKKSTRKNKQTKAEEEEEEEAVKTNNNSNVNNGKKWNVNPFGGDFRMIKNAHTHTFSPVVVAIRMWCTHNFGLNASNCAHLLKRCVYTSLKCLMNANKVLKNMDYDFHVIVKINRQIHIQKYLTLYPYLLLLMFFSRVQVLGSLLLEIDWGKKQQQQSYSLSYRSKFNRNQNQN